MAAVPQSGLECVLCLRQKKMTDGVLVSWCFEPSQPLGIISGLIQWVLFFFFFLLHNTLTA